MAEATSTEISPALTPPNPMPYGALAACLAVAIAAAGLILIRSPLINGSSFWHWSYIRDPVSAGWALLAGAIAGGLVTAAWALFQRHGPSSLAVSLAIVAIAAFLLRLSASWMMGQEVSLGFVDGVVRSPVVGSYYTVAQVDGGRPDLLEVYPTIMARMPLHAKNKPPGTVLLNLAFIRALGDDPDQQTAAMVGLSCGLMSLLSIPLLAALVRALGGSVTAGFHAAALWAVVPGAAIFFPLFDPLLTVPALLMALAWTHAMRRDRFVWSIAMGATLAVTLFFTFNILPIGLFLAAIGFASVPGAWPSRAKRFSKHSAIVLAVAAGLHLAFHWLTGFNLIETVRAALANQATLLRTIPRPYPDTVWWDLIDYALGVAWVPVVLAIAYVLRLGRAGRPRTLLEITIVAGMAQLVVTAITALLPGETARVWNFLIPLILLPAAIELDRWPRWWPPVVYVSIPILTALMARSMVFMYIARI